MSLIVSQTPVNRLPAELVNNAAFVKQVDFDSAHQTAEAGVGESVKEVTQ